MFANKTLQAITSVGTGAYQLNTTGTGSWQTWRSQFSTGAQVAYYAENADGTVWEYGYGTLTTGTPDQISRNVTDSSTGSIIDWASGDGTVYVMSVPWSEALEGRWDATNSMFAPAGRKPWTATGTSGLNVTAAHAGGRYSFDTSAAARTVTLPAIADVPMGFNIEVWGLSASYPLILDPAASDAIDATAGGTNVALPGNCNTLLISDGTQWRTVFRNTPALGVPKGYLFGLEFSTAGSSTTATVSAGEAADSTGAKIIKLASSMSKTTGAWSAGTGNGGLDTGTIANSTSYHFHLIENVATGVQDVLISTSATAPTMPSGYTLARRLFGARTDGSGKWIKAIQNGDEFRLETPLDYSAVPGSTSRGSLSLGVPTGVVVNPHLMVSVTAGGGSGCTALLTSLDETDTAPSGTLNHGSVPSAATQSAVFEVRTIHTNTSGQIGRRINTTDGQVNVKLMGWTDRRGRDA